MIKQTRDENKEKYRLGDYLLIQYQIPILHLKNCMGISKENDLLDLGSARVIEFHFKRNSVKRQIFLPN